MKSGYLCIPNKKWQRRFFVLKPTTMLYYFSSNMDEEPLGCIDVEAFSAVECCDVGADGRVTLELSRPGEGSEAARFMALNNTVVLSIRCWGRVATAWTVAVTASIAAAIAAVRLARRLS